LLLLLLLLLPAVAASYERRARSKCGELRVGAALESGMRQLHPRGVGACGALDEQGPFSLRECLPLLAQAPFPLRVTQGRQARPLPLAEEHVCTVNKEVARECACAEWGGVALVWRAGFWREGLAWA